MARSLGAPFDTLLAKARSNSAVATLLQRHSPSQREKRAFRVLHLLVLVRLAPFICFRLHAHLIPSVALALALELALVLAIALAAAAAHTSFLPQLIALPPTPLFASCKPSPPHLHLLLRSHLRLHVLLPPSVALALAPALALVIALAAAAAAHNFPLPQLIALSPPLSLAVASASASASASHSHSQ